MTVVTAGLLHGGSLLTNQSVDSWSTGHSDQMEEKINAARRRGMLLHFIILPSNHFIIDRNRTSSSESIPLTRSRLNYRRILNFLTTSKWPRNRMWPSDNRKSDWSIPRSIHFSISLFTYTIGIPLLNSKGFTFVSFFIAEKLVKLMVNSKVNFNR